MTRQGIKPSEPLLASVTRAGIGTWVGAISFEERCLGSLEHLVQTGSRVRRVVALDYSTTTAPGGEGEERRELHWGRMRELASGLHAEECVRRPVNPYSFADIVDALEAEAGALATRQVPLILDITCLTKIHAVAAGVCLANLDKAERNWLSAYTSPRSFCDLTSMDRRFGWRDILIVPLVEGARLYNEASGRGLIVLGHEQDRLVVALREMQPGGGTIILPWEPTRPDLRYVMERNNRYVVRELAPHTVAGWRKKQVQLGDVGALQLSVEAEVNLAREKQAPVVLFPMGPKLMVLWSARVIADAYASGGWVVYPVPGGYDPDYSEGIERTIWMAPSWTHALSLAAAAAATF